jgi:hypothetical protein
MANKSKPAPKQKTHKPDARVLLLTRANTMNSENRQLDFKGEFHSTKEGWCGVIKDIMAMANTGGGIIVFGCHSDGKSSGVDCAHVADIDVANFTNKIFSYTGYHFGDLEVLSVRRGRDLCPVLLVGAADIPVPFTRPGEYDVTDAKGKKHDKIAFHAGTIYFRHGAKSEPATRADIGSWIKRHVEQERKAMMDGVKKVVTAPSGSVVHVLPKGSKLQVSDDAVIKVKISNDADAIKVVATAVGDTHPLLRKELIRAVKRACGRTISTHDVVALNHHLKVFKEHPEFANKPHKVASPQYSSDYVEHLAKQLVSDDKLVAKAREAYRTRSKT